MFRYLLCYMNVMNGIIFKLLLSHVTQYSQKKILVGVSCLKLTSARLSASLNSLHGLDLRTDHGVYNLEILSLSLSLSLIQYYSKRYITFTAVPVLSLPSNYDTFNTSVYLWLASQTALSKIVLTLTLQPCIWQH